MPVTSIDTDLDALSITVIADFAVPVTRVWDAYLDPRQIERFWGPPTYPSTFLQHDATPGGRTVYRMTGPEGDTHYGCWDWVSVDAPHSFAVVDRFADESGQPNLDLPGWTMTFSFEATPTGSRLTNTSRADSLEALQQMIEMGVLEGTREAMAQIDAVLVEDPS